MTQVNHAEHGAESMPCVQAPGYDARQRPTGTVCPLPARRNPRAMRVPCRRPEGTKAGPRRAAGGLQAPQTGHPLRKAGCDATQRANMVAQQTGPANGPDVECAFFSVRQHSRDRGSLDLRQRNAFMPLLVHVAAEDSLAGTLVHANQPVQDQPLAIRKEQKGAQLGVSCVKRAHDHDRSARNQRVHTVPGGGESDPVALLQKRDNGAARAQGRHVGLLGGDGHVFFC